MSRVFCSTPRSHRQGRTFHKVPTTAPAPGYEPSRSRLPRQRPALFATIAWRLMPLLIAGYILNYLDRNNVGFAALTMNRALGLTATKFGRAGDISFWGTVSSSPHNIALYGRSPGPARADHDHEVVMSAATIFATGTLNLYLLRFLLGVAEAGFFPGVAFYLGKWCPSEYARG